MWYNDFFTDKTTNDAKQILLKEYIKSVKKTKTHTTNCTQRNYRRTTRTI